ncbi:MAG: signal peptidase I [Bacteroidales bacterium]|nr:signal peptidase I [Bacteroidales bacterium]
MTIEDQQIENQQINKSKINKSKLFGWILPLIVAVAVALVAWHCFRDRIYVVEGDAMSPTLKRGQNVWVEYGGAVRRNDIVLVSNPFAQKGAALAPMFRRCFCVPGDTITRLQAHQLYGPAVVPRCGTKVHLNYANYMIYKDLAMKYEGVRMEWRDTVCTVDGTIADTYTFRRDYVFLTSDNRADKCDSRTFGPVPREVIGAKIKFVF